jgi:hypothetical protein
MQQKALLAAIERELTVCSWLDFAGRSARATQSNPHILSVRGHQAENDVPQPQDFEAWGFTKTKPCCISVS